jgi:parallel beta helix pectate lyase-like protein
MVRRISLAILAVAVAGGLAPSTSASANHVSCGDTITKDTKLDRNLVNCPNNGVVIGADNIRLDLNGHTIDGDGDLVANCPGDEFCDTGVANDGHDGITIAGGNIREFGAGVFLFQASGNRLRHLSSSLNHFNGITIIESARSRVQRDSVSRNGLTADFPGIAVIGSHHIQIERTSSTGNADLGFFVIESDDNSFIRNRLSGNPEAAMIVDGNRNEIHGNRSFGNGDIIVAGNRNTITRNHVLGSQAGSEGGGFGISFEGGHDNLIARNIVARTSEAGIRLAAFEPEGGPPAVDNVVRRNHLRDADQDGVLVESTVTDTLLDRNHAVGSEDDGIDVESRTTILTRNHAVHNGDLGIEAVPGVTDGGKNKAHGNGDPRQCTNVVCR